MVLCPEDRKLDGIIQERSIEENIAISSRRHFSPFGILSLGKEGALADQFIAKLRIRTPSRRQDIINLSGGNQQKVILGRWLSEQGIKVLVIDEPTRGIDVGAKSEIYEILYDLAAGGMAIVMISSELPEVMGVSDRIIVMCGGRVAATVERKDFNEHRILTAALPDKTAVTA
jgi:L-arabinose transport system ATP-binding protein